MAAPAVAGAADPSADRLRGGDCRHDGRERHRIGRGLAADAAVGTVKVVGKGVGMAADALSSDPAPDNSGIQIREPIRPAP